MPKSVAMGLVESLAFPAPPPLSATLRAAENMRFVSTARGNRVPLVVEAAPDAPYCIIYSHGIAVDLGLVLPFSGRFEGGDGLHRDWG